MFKFDFLYYDRDLVNPKITIFLNQKINWMKYYSNWDDFWYNHLSIQWKPLTGMTCANENNFCSKNFLGTYSFGQKSEIIIFFKQPSKNTLKDKNFWD